jgi:hypothetical protein
MRLQRRQGALEGLDRVGSLGGQVLGGSAAGTFKLQGVLEFSNSVITRLADRWATRAVVLFWIRSPDLAWPQTGCEQVPGRDSPEPTLTGDGAWLLVGGWEASGGQVAADRRGRHPAQLSRLSDRQLGRAHRSCFESGCCPGSSCSGWSPL